MFFLRGTKKSYLKGKKYRSGQIFPILLICIAGLIIAIFNTRNVGEANLASTQAENAADSGSLSAASCMAGSLNRLVYRNWKQNSNEQSMGQSGVGYWNKYMGYSTGFDNNYYYYKPMDQYYIDMQGEYGALCGS